MKILVTGAAGFIGFHLAARLVASGHEVVGLDNINNYYDPSLKFDRLKELGIPTTEAQLFGKICISSNHGLQFTFVRMELEDNAAISALFKEHEFDVVCHLAAQAGVRYSLQNPHTYINSNITGFLNILEGSRQNGVKHLVYASSSSVYGLNTKIPFMVEDRVDQPISLYAATKRSNELMAHTYSYLYGLPTTGLRFFTVYGPWGRPDMALFLFTDAILNDRPIDVYNHGEMERDFTYIDDIVEGVFRILVNPYPSEKEAQNPPASLYNIGNNKAVRLDDFIVAIEKQLGKKANKNLLPLQPGDVTSTWADVSNLKRDYHYGPQTSIDEGVKKFIRWYKDYYAT